MKQMTEWQKEHVREKCERQREQNNLTESHKLSIIL